ncbi:MAG: LysE family translocator [Deltaproteobacteria bacterium]|nr:LysE family translocator [Deltaproteobacteria bacterium]
MFNHSSFNLFLVTCIILVMTPGPDTLYVLARSLGQGRRAGIISAIGICCGFLIHTAAAAIGLSAILMTSALAFSVVKYTGACYLFYLGIRTLATRTAHAVPILTAVVYQRLFTQGFITNVLNPKVAIFFLAFVPQFVDPTRSAVSSQVIVYGLIDMGMCLIWLSGIAIIAGSARQWLVRQRAFWSAQRCFTGGILLFLGIRLLLTEFTSE